MYQLIFSKDARQSRVDDDIEVLWQFCIIILHYAFTILEKKFLLHTSETQEGVLVCIEARVRPHRTIGYEY